GGCVDGGRCRARIVLGIRIAGGGGGGIIGDSASRRRGIDVDDERESSRGRWSQRRRGIGGRDRTRSTRGRCIYRPARRRYEGDERRVRWDDIRQADAARAGRAGPAVG